MLQLKTNAILSQSLHFPTLLLLPVSQPHVQLVFDNPVLFSHYFHQESELHQDTHCQVQPKLKLVFHSFLCNYHHKKNKHLLKNPQQSYLHIPVFRFSQYKQIIFYSSDPLFSIFISIPNS